VAAEANRAGQVAAVVNPAEVAEIVAGNRASLQLRIIKKGGLIGSPFSVLDRLVCSGHAPDHAHKNDEL